MYSSVCVYVCVHKCVWLESGKSSHKPLPISPSSSLPPTYPPFFQPQPSCLRRRFRKAVGSWAQNSSLGYFSCWLTSKGCELSVRFQNQLWIWTHLGLKAAAAAGLWANELTCSRPSARSPILPGHHRRAGLQRCGLNFVCSQSCSEWSGSHFSSLLLLF